MSRTHPVRSYDGQHSADDIALALALLRVCKVATFDPDWVDAETVRAVSETLGLAERYLEAGAEWARDTQNQITHEENEKFRRKLERAKTQDGAVQ